MNEIIALITRHGPMVVFAVAFLEQIGMPVPAIPVIIVAGALARSTNDSILQLLLLAIAGALLADLIWYTLGRRYGSRVLGTLCRVSLSPDSCVRQTEGFFERWGLVSLLFAKWVPGFSLVAPPLAGALPRSRTATFLLYDTLGSIGWAGAALGVGVLFHGRIERLLEALSALGGWALVILGSLLAIYILTKWWERRRFYHALRMGRMTVGELRQRMDSGRIVVLDARTPFQQQTDPGRIPGALMIRADEIEKILADVPKEVEIVLYCT